MLHRVAATTNAKHAAKRKGNTNIFTFWKLETANLWNIWLERYLVDESLNLSAVKKKKVLVQKKLFVVEYRLLKGNMSHTVPLSLFILWYFVRHGPVGLVHVDAHADTSDVVLGEKIGHGTPFRRCVEEGLLDCKRVVQIGLRGTGYSADSYEWSRAQVENWSSCRWHKAKTWPNAVTSTPVVLIKLSGCWLKWLSFWN